MKKGLWSFTCGWRGSEELSGFKQDNQVCPYFLNLGLHMNPLLEGKSWRLWHSGMNNFLVWQSLLSKPPQKLQSQHNEHQASFSANSCI